MAAKGTSKPKKKLNTKQLPGGRELPKPPTEFAIYRCVSCGVEKKDDEFYKGGVGNMWHASDGRVLICKDCINAMFDSYTAEGNERYAVQRLCHKLEWYYDEKAYQAVIKKNKFFDISAYLPKITPPAARKGYDQTIDEQNAIIASVQEEKNFKASEESWTEQENQNKDEVIDILGYDPFDGYALEDRRRLFGELVKYFDDDISDDAYKLSAVVQIVTNNHQIRQYDMEILKTDAAKFADKVTDLQVLKAKLTNSNNHIAKENEISVKNRSNKEVGKNTLTYLMKDLRQKNFKDAEENYYDQLKGAGTLWAADMSMKAIQQNAMFDENDKQEMFNIQRALIEDLQKQLDDALEEKRQLIIERDELARKNKELGRTGVDNND